VQLVVGQGGLQVRGGEAGYRPSGRPRELKRCGRGQTGRSRTGHDDSQGRVAGRGEVTGIRGEKDGVGKKIVQGVIFRRKEPHSAG
jgi:hypothetical protein